MFKEVLSSFLFEIMEENLYRESSRLLIFILFGFLSYEMIYIYHCIIRLQNFFYVELYYIKANAYQSLTSIKDIYIYIFRYLFCNDTSIMKSCD